MTHQWNLKQYEKFENERHQPFFDLLQMIHAVDAPRILDLGCGNGSLTQWISEKFQASYTLGIDTSQEMLAKAYTHQSSHLFFKEQNIQNFISKDRFDIIISNDALQWFPNHSTLFSHFSHLLVPGGQLAIQIPANQHYPTHVIARELAEENPFKQALKEQTFPFNHLLKMEEYAKLLDQLKFESQVIRLQMYAHFLESTASIIEWVKGSLLTYYQSHLEPELYAQFFKEYQQRVIQHLGWSEPFFFPMKHLFIWGQL